MIKVYLFFAILVISMKSHGQEKPARLIEDASQANDTTVYTSQYSPGMLKGNFEIDVDQDWFLDFMIPGTNEDRNYTQGTAFTYTKYDLDETVLFLPLYLFHRLLFGSSSNDHIVKQPASVSLGVTAFTPRELADSLNPVVGDRPFANVVFLRTAYRYYNTKTKFFTTNSFSYGIIGSNIGNTFQSFAHKSIVKGRPTNIGWQYQISDGGRPAFLFSHESLRSIVDKEIKHRQLKDGESTYAKKSSFQMFLGYRANLGWYNSIAAIATARIGKFSKLSNIFGVATATATANSIYSPDGSMKDSTETKKRIRKKEMYYFPGATPAGESVTKNGREIVTMDKVFDWYFFGSLSPRVMPYNSLILGQPFHKSPYSLPKQNYNPFVLDMELGFFMSWLKALPDHFIPFSRTDVLISWNARTSEIISKDPTVHNPYKRTHSWGRVTLRFPLF